MLIKDADGGGSVAVADEDESFSWRLVSAARFLYPGNGRLRWKAV